jgi:RNA polymerase sigma-70 factor (ECF subfamily)
MASGQERDFATFYDTTWGQTVACAFAVTADLAAAEDCAQEAYTRAWPRWSRLLAYEDPSGWVRQVAIRLAISRWRRTRTALAFLRRTRVPENAAGPDENAVALAVALNRIEAKQRRAIVLHHLADLSVAEVARLENCPEGTVKARLARGRAALAPLLDDTAGRRQENSHV